MSSSASAILLALLLLFLLTACINPLARPKGTTYYFDEEGNLLIGEHSDQGESPPLSPESDSANPPSLPLLQQPGEEPVILNAADMEQRQLQAESPTATNKTTVSITVIRITNTSRYELSLLPDPYLPEGLTPLHDWEEADGYCGERLNVFKKEQTKAEKIPRIALYGKIACAFRCADGEYLVELYPNNVTMLPYKNFTLANKTCTSECLGRQAGWSC